MKRYFLFAMAFLMLFGCVQQPLEDDQESVLNQEDVVDDIQETQNEEENHQIVFHQYKLNVYNLQDTFYKNSTVYMILDADSNLGTYKMKTFRMDPVVEVQMKQNDEWVTVNSFEVSGIDGEEKNQAEIIFDFELSDFEYEDGMYRLKAKVYEEDKYADLVSEETEWVSRELENAPLSSNEYLKLYPFNLYDEDGMFSQNRANVGEAAIIRVLPKGCAVIAKDVGYQKIHHVPCEILNSDECQFVGVKDVFDVQGQELFARRFINGFRDEELYQKGHLADSAAVMDWIESLDDVILIPNCFDVSYELGNEENYSFELTQGNEILRCTIIQIEESKGAFIQVDQEINRQVSVLAVMWTSTQMTKDEFEGMLK